MKSSMIRLHSDLDFQTKRLLGIITMGFNSKPLVKVDPREQPNSFHNTKCIEVIEPEGSEKV